MKRRFFICLLAAFLMISAVSCKKTENSCTCAEIADEKYSEDGMEADYPRLVSGGGEDELKLWNQIIYEDFKNIWNIYSFHPFPEITPTPSSTVPTILKIKYDMKINDADFISILYNAAYNSPYSAHPSDLVYTTNISKKDGRRLKLSDIVNPDENFVKNFRTWDIEFSEPQNMELQKAVKDYLDNLSNEDLVKGFLAADKIGSGNLWDIYSYLTPQRLGISLGAPHYLGDHIELETDYTNISEFLKPEIKKILLK